jgi:serine protease AprX
MLKKMLLILILLPVLSWSQQKYWIFFKDKGFNAGTKNEALSQAKETFLKKALDRRAKVLSEKNLLDESDLPINQTYLEKVKLIGIKPIVTSKWLNGISARLKKNQIESIKSMSFIKSVKLVSSFKIKLPEKTGQTFLTKTQTYSLDYGSSLQQNEMMKVPEVHDLGLDGNGVLVGMLDTGYNYKMHEAFQHLKVLGEYDVINQDSVTNNEEGDPSSQVSHGTITLSALAGFKGGKLIGPAYGASFLLAKTEVSNSETKVEEDNWVAGLEWMERNGVDVVSSSLGYNDWYDYSDMDGETAITTNAASIAAKKGVVVVNSNGNEGNVSWRHMIAPADGADVISVGAVHNTGDLVGFSSRGPTYDGRTKPDVVAMGQSVACVSVGSIDTYRTANGTSLSCPLVAGVAALVLQAHPYLTPYQVRDALRETANNAIMPNDDYGWGLVNAYEAVFYHGLFFSSMPEIFINDQLGHLVKIKILSKYKLISDSLFVHYAIEDETVSSLKLSPTGTDRKFQVWLPLQAEDTQIKIHFSAADISGDSKRFPHNAPESYFTFNTFDSTISKYEPLPEDFKLYQNYPNPFTSNTTIEYDIFIPGKASLTIYNIRGQKVKMLVNDYHSQERFIRFWNGLDDNGIRVSAGIYFYKLKAGGTSIVKRLVYWGNSK